MISFTKFISENHLDDYDHDRELKKSGFWGKAGAGCFLFANSNKSFLVPYRSLDVEQPHTW